jgi:hypothetical protein
MTTVTLNETAGGLKIPGGLGNQALMLVMALLASAFASVVFQAVRPGSVIVLSYLLPTLFVLWTARDRLFRTFSNVVCIGFLLASLVSVAIEPGWLNMGLAWALLLANAVVLPQAGDKAPLSILEAMLGQFASGSKRSLRDGVVAGGVALALPLAAPKPKLTSIALPLFAALVFAALLMTANPLVEKFLASFDFGNPLWFAGRFWDGVSSPLFLFFALSFAALWPVLRGEGFLRSEALRFGGDAPWWHRAFFQPSAVIATLLILNGMFAFANLLDLQYVWSAAQLPPGLTHAEYVHRGSYTLIATAILAALLMVFILRKGTATEESVLVRALVYLWTAQNLLLVASSAKRTLSYVEDYGWTEWRVSGLIWMALVFVGLVTIAARVLMRRDTLWQVNTNLVASLMVLLACSGWDMRGFIAERNVDRVIANSAVALDHAYLGELGVASLPSLKRAQFTLKFGSSSHGGGYFSGVDLEIVRLERDLRRQQEDWRSWTFGGARIQQGHVARLPAPGESEMNRE